jgi:hypothetical protein
MSMNGISCIWLASFEAHHFPRILFGQDHANWTLIVRTWETAKQLEDVPFRQLVLPLAKLTRNLVAQVPGNQEKALYVLPPKG